MGIESREALQEQPGQLGEVAEQRQREGPSSKEGAAEPEDLIWWWHQIYRRWFSSLMLCRLELAQKNSVFRLNRPGFFFFVFFFSGGGY